MLINSHLEIFRTQLTLLLQKNSIDITDATLEKVYKFALLAEKMVPEQTSLTAAAIVQSSSRNGTFSFYCGQPGLLLTVPKRIKIENPVKNTWIQEKKDLRRNMNGGFQN